jgi:hypothetical protein
MACSGLSSGSPASVAVCRSFDTGALFEEEPPPVCRFSGGQMETILAWDSKSHGGTMPEGYLHLTCIEAVANQARGNAIEHAPQNEAATRCNEHARFLEVGCSALGERPQRGALNLDALAVSGIAPRSGIATH